MTDVVIAIGVWAAVTGIWYHHWRFTRWAQALDEMPPAVAPDAPNMSDPRTVPSEAAWSAEGWGPPDSEVISTEGDDYLARMHRPLPTDES